MKNDGGPAFPLPSVSMVDMVGRTYFEGGQSGMSLREWYAGLAMQGQLACGEIADPTPAGVAKYAVEYAVALLTELKKTP